jgi:curved DNA-binding protein CbpA
MTTERNDPYAILGLARDASQAQISDAYRHLLRRYHPDTRAPADTSRGASADAALQRVLTAYAVLRDPGRRADYDLETTPRSTAARSQPSPIHLTAVHLSPIHPFDDPPLRAGPVHWTPSPTVTNRRDDR